MRLRWCIQWASCKRSRKAMHIALYAVRVIDWMDWDYLYESSCPKPLANSYPLAKIPRLVDLWTNKWMHPSSKRQWSRSLLFKTFFAQDSVPRLTDLALLNKLGMLYKCCRRGTVPVCAVHIFKWICRIQFHFCNVYTSTCCNQPAIWTILNLDSVGLHLDVASCITLRACTVQFVYLFLSLLLRDAFIYTSIHLRSIFQCMFNVSFIDVELNSVRCVLWHCSSFARLRVRARLRVWDMWRL